MRRYFIETWGCQMNLHDSQRLEGQLLSLGLTPSPNAEEAELILLNTCSVRERAAQKVVSRIGELALLPQAPVVGVCGCVAEQEAQALLTRSRVVGFVLGPGQIARLGDALAACAAGERVVYVGFSSRSVTAPSSAARHGEPRGMLTVVEGCSQHCTFCVVPYTRGAEMSRPMDQLLVEVTGMLASGVKEVELLGQTINAYRCPKTGAGFAELLATVASLPALERVRFVTSHPRFLNDELIATIAAHPRVSRYLHLPVQAGSDRVLRRMRRRYTRGEYLDLVGRIRTTVPDVNLSTDVITGFPGETEDDFLETLDLLATVRFGQVFAFAFSPRPRTPAARYQDQVPEAVRKERLHRLFELSDRISGELNQTLVGKAIRVMVDGPSRRTESDLQGRGEDNRVVNFRRSGGERVGDIVEVRITRANPHSLVGELVGDKRPTELPIVAPSPGSLAGSASCPP